MLEINRGLGEKTLLVTVEAVEPNAIQVRLDGRSAEPGGVAGLVNVPMNSYQAVDHGYATTIHKNRERQSTALSRWRPRA